MVLGGSGGAHPLQPQKRLHLGRGQEGGAPGLLGRHISLLYAQTIAQAQFTTTIMQEDRAYWEDALDPSLPRTVMRGEPPLTSRQPCGTLRTTMLRSLLEASASQKEALRDRRWRRRPPGDTTREDPGILTQVLPNHTLSNLRNPKPHTAVLGGETGSLRMSLGG